MTIDMMLKPEHAFRDVLLSEVQTPGVVCPEEQGGFVLKPRDMAQAAKLLYHAFDQQQPLTLLSQDVGYLEQPVQLSLERLDQVIHHADEDLVISVEAGITMGQLQQLLGEKNQAFPLNYAPETRLIDLLGEDRPSLETGFAGYPRDYVLGLDVLTPDGKRYQTGGQVVKNVTGYDLNKWLVGSHHTLGVICGATLKCIARPEAQRDWCITYDSYQSASLALQALLEEGVPLAYAEIVHEIRIKPDLDQEFVDWSLFFGVRGSQSLMPTVVPQVCRILDLDLLTSVLHPQEAQTYWNRLNHYESRDLVLEVALPVSEIQRFITQVENDLPESMWPWVQVRPQAGLIYLIWAFGEGVPSVQQLRILCGEWLDALTSDLGYLRGHLHWVQFPRGYQSLSQYCNLPREALARKMMRDLKAFADPQGILLSSRLPVGPHFDGITLDAILSGIILDEAVLDKSQPDRNQEIE